MQRLITGGVQESKIEMALDELDKNEEVYCAFQEGFGSLENQRRGDQTYDGKSNILYFLRLRNCEVLANTYSNELLHTMSSEISLTAFCLLHCSPSPNLEASPFSIGYSLL